METPSIHNWPSWILWHTVILGVPIAIGWAIANWRRYVERKDRKYFLDHAHGCDSRNRKGCTNGNK